MNRSVSLQLVKRVTVSIVTEGTKAQNLVVIPKHVLSDYRKSVLSLKYSATLIGA